MSKIDHSSLEHSPLGPSGAARWLACPASVSMSEGLTDTAGAAADEGTLCHEIGEAFLRLKLEGVEFDPLEFKQHRHGQYYSQELVRHAEAYADYCIEFTDEGDWYEIEQRYDLSAYVPDNFGRGDYMVYKPKALHLIDLKYGRVRVEAKNNPQLKLYGLGAIEFLKSQGEKLPMSRKVVLHVYQPRIGNFVSFNTTVGKLTQWGELVVRPIAEEALAGSSRFKLGPHCKYCKAKLKCPEMMGFAQDVATSEFTLNSVASAKLVFSIASTLSSLVDEAKSLLYAKLMSGEGVDGLMLVEGTPRRSWAADTETIVKAFEEYGYGMDVTLDKKVRALTTVEKEVSVDDWQTITKALIKVSEPDPILTTEDDTRTPYIAVDPLKLFENYE